MGLCRTHVRISETQHEGEAEMQKLLQRKSPHCERDKHKLKGQLCRGTSLLKNRRSSLSPQTVKEDERSVIGV